MGSSSQLPQPPTTSPPSNRKFRMDLALGNRADRYISPMRIQNFRARWGFLYPPLVASSCPPSLPPRAPVQKSPSEIRADTPALSIFYINKLIQ